MPRGTSEPASTPATVRMLPSPPPTTTGVDLSCLGALERGLGEQLQLGPAAEFQLCHDIERVERGGEFGAQAIGALVARRARGRVQQGDQSQALGRERSWRCHRAQPLPASSM